MASYQELLAQREALDKQIEESRKSELGTAVAQVRQLIAAWGLTAEDCGFKGGVAVARKSKGTAVAAKYRGPAGETWTGRGRAPGWLAKLEAEGHARSEYLIG